MDHPEKILGIPFVSNDQPVEVLQPGKQPFNFPPTAIPSQAHAYDSDQLDAELNTVWHRTDLSAPQKQEKQDSRSLSPTRFCGASLEPLF
jgi:hypothetical protein